MKKCDFCEKSSPSGKCTWSIPSCRDSDCRKAIKRMMEVLQNTDTKKKQKFFR